MVVVLASFALYKKKETTLTSYIILIAVKSSTSKYTIVSNTTQTRYYTWLKWLRYHFFENFVNLYANNIERVTNSVWRLCELKTNE